MEIDSSVSSEMIREAANVQASQIAKPVVRKEESTRKSSPRVDANK